jgi:maleylpyruvate isomerase
MSPDASAPDPRRAPGPQDQLHDLLRTATGQLLGATIAVRDEEWRAPSRLPGWSAAATLATHLARQADAAPPAHGWRLGGSAGDVPVPRQREAEIEPAAGRPGLELQIDLDTSAGLLEEAFAAVRGAVPGTWRSSCAVGLRVPARLLRWPLPGGAVHHVDLGRREWPTSTTPPRLACWSGAASGCAGAGRVPPARARLPHHRITVRQLRDCPHRPRPQRRSLLGLAAWNRRTDGADLEGVDGLRLPAF